jgi:hypothetical protein
MTIYSLQAVESNSRRRAREARDFRVMFYATFLIFLVVGAIKRLLSPMTRDGNRRSLITEAKAAAHTCLPFAFMI